MLISFAAASGCLALAAPHPFTLRDLPIGSIGAATKRIPQPRSDVQCCQGEGSCKGKAKPTAANPSYLQRRLLVQFSAGSSLLSEEAKLSLDSLADGIARERGFIIEVTGFASSDGSEVSNRELSQRRADAVIRCLAQNHGIPLPRFINPFGFAEELPMADNKTHDGRVQNRRAEVRVLVSKALSENTADSSL